MARKKIREYDGKRLVTRHLTKVKGIKLGGAGKQIDNIPTETAKPAVDSSDLTAEPVACRAAQVSNAAIQACGGNTEAFYEKLAEEHSWLPHTKLVVKPDMLFGKRGKHNLVLLNADYDVAQSFIAERLNQPLEVSGVKGVLSTFLIEPFVPHSHEYYFCVQTVREGDRLRFGACGGIDIEENWHKVRSVVVPAGLPDAPAAMQLNVEEHILPLLTDDDIPNGLKVVLGSFIKACYETYVELDMTLLEMNPFAIDDALGLPAILDTRVELDSYALFKNTKVWRASPSDPVVDLPEPWGLDKTEEEKAVQTMDDKSSASLKLTILNPRGRLWTMVAGGGASVIYTDQVVQLGFGDELGNYAEYSGNPKKQETYLFARTLLNLVTRDPDGRRRALLCGGGVANFSDVAATFAGLQQALTDFHGKLQMAKVKVFVRRGGPNYKVGLQIMRDLGKNLDIPIEVYGPDMDMTNIVSLGIRWIEEGV